MGMEGINLNKDKNDDSSKKNEQVEKDKNILEKINRLAVAKYKKYEHTINFEVLPNLDESVMDSVTFSNFESDFGGGSYAVFRSYIEDIKKYIILGLVIEKHTNYGWDYIPNLKTGDLLTEEEFQAEVDSYEGMYDDFEDEYRNPSGVVYQNEIIDGKAKGFIIDAFNNELRGDNSYVWDGKIEEFSRELKRHFTEKVRELNLTTDMIHEVEQKLNKENKENIFKQRNNRSRK